MGWFSDFVSNPISTIGNTGQSIIDTTKNVGTTLDQTVRDTIPGGWTTAALLTAGAYFSPELNAWVAADGSALPAAAPAATPVAPGSLINTTVGQDVSGWFSGGSPATTATGTGLTASGGLGLTAPTATTGLGLTAPAATAGLDLTAPAFTGMGITAGGTGLGLTLPEATTGLGLVAPAASGLATGTAAGLTGADLAGIGAGLGTSSLASGTGSLLGTGAAAGALGTTLGTGAGLAGLTAEQLGTLGLIQGGLGLVGGLLGGQSASNATSTAAAQQAALANKTLDIGKFTPVGTTTTFGTSNFTVDPVTGQITQAGYTLSPQAQAIQDAIMGGTRSSLQDTAALQNLGRGYISTSPEAAAQDWMNKQLALLQPGRDVESARLANQLQQTGRTGVSVAQGGNLAAANPEQQALANARALQDLQLAAQAQQQGQNQVTFGQGLLSGAYQPVTAGLTAASNLESLAQQPFGLSTNLANLASTAGARQAANYAGAMGNSIALQQAANSYNPWGTVLQGASSNPLLGLGLMNAFA